jgi:hypothetical protein
VTGRCSVCGRVFVLVYREGDTAPSVVREHGGDGRRCRGSEMPPLAPVKASS